MIEHQHPVEHFSRGVDDADSLRSGLRTADFGVEPAFFTFRGIVDKRGLEGDGDEIGVDAANDVGLGENRLTGGAGEDSAAGIIDRAIDEDPEQDRFILLARFLESLEQTTLPLDFAPRDFGRFQGLDFGQQRCRRCLNGALLRLIRMQCADKKQREADKECPFAHGVRLYEVHYETAGDQGVL
jgi:hypothetical protein